MLTEHLPDLLTIIVPRHPDRVDDILHSLSKFQVEIATRSSGDIISPSTGVYVGDSIGEMGLYFGLAEVAFMGKSLKSQGGQNPIEPVMSHAAILSGPYVQNFRDTYQALLESGGARLVKDENMLAGHVLHLLRNPHDLHAMQTAARNTVYQMTGALERTIAALDPYIMPLRVQAGLDKRLYGEDPVSAHGGQ